MVRPVRPKLNDIIKQGKGFSVPIHDFRELGLRKEEGEIINRYNCLNNMMMRWSSLRVRIVEVIVRTRQQR
jgi:hypothetical protein